jgi:hypothetical protein
MHIPARTALAAAHRIPSRLGAALLAALLLLPLAAHAQDEGTDESLPAPSEDGSAPPPPPEAAPPKQAPDQAAFDAALAPHGRWVDTPDYGRVWIPNATSDAGWQPYTDGRWVWTAWGWSFNPGVPWGWAVFHYGRWGWRAGWGWYWVPGYTWGPAWVSWRWSAGHYCWAPYGPRGYVYGPAYRGWVVVPRAQFRAPIAAARVVGVQANTIVRGAVRMRTIPHSGGVHPNPGLRAGANHPAPGLHQFHERAQVRSAPPRAGKHRR